MCGRFALSAPVDTLRRQFDVSGDFDLQPRYNIAPGQQVAVLRAAGSGRELVECRWGLIPFWAKEAGFGRRLINARAETLEEKPSFRTSFKRYRCLIPADGFYEWKELPGRKGKQPYFIRMRDGGLFAMAGLWSSWRERETGEIIESCAIITTGPNSLLAAIHNRMPAILGRDRYDAWLDGQTRPGDLKKMLGPFEAEGMEAHPVSGLCNSPKNDSPECVKEIN